LHEHNNSFTVGKKLAVQKKKKKNKKKKTKTKNVQNGREYI
jgi:hypothetical protein